MEIWKILKYRGNLYDKYEISDKGNIRNTKTHKIYKQNLGTKGYMQYTLYLGRDDNKKSIVINMEVHRAVAETFIPNLNNLPVVNHKNGIKTFNYVENLEWCTVKYNIIHARDNGLLNLEPSDGINNPKSKLSIEDIEYIRTHYKIDKTCKDLMLLFNVSKSTIQNAYHKRTYKRV